MPSSLLLYRHFQTGNAAGHSLPLIQDKMYRIKLIRPRMDFAGQIMQYSCDFTEHDPSECMGGCGNLRKCANAAEWIEGVERLVSADSCPEGYAVSDTYLAVREPDNRLVGFIELRHSIDSTDLSEWAGHIGYSVRPSDRRRGHAKEMLRQVLDRARELGMDRLLLCCDEDNIASERTILANGGKFERMTEINGRTVKRFWITL